MKNVVYSFYDLVWKETLDKFYSGNADLLLLSEDPSEHDVHVFKTTEKQNDEQMI